MSNIIDSKGFTFRQSYTPISACNEDTWFDTSSGQSFIYYNNNWIKISRACGPGTSYGYTFGGYTTKSTISRITFPFDSGTSPVIGYLGASKLRTYACNSQTKGYICGGLSSVYVSSIETITFPFDSGNSSSVGKLKESKAYGSSFNSNSYGYLFGGYYTAGLASVEKLDFSSDSGNTLSLSNLPSILWYSGACNSSNYGYSCGGYKTSSISSISRFSFGTQGSFIQVGNLSTTMYSNSSCNSSNYGYSCGGYNMSVTVSYLNRIQFSLDSDMSSTVGYLTASSMNASSCNSTNYGYVCQGYGTDYVSSIERFTFPFGSGSSIKVGSISSGVNSDGSACDGTDFVSMFI